MCCFIARYLRGDAGPARRLLSLGWVLRHWKLGKESEKRSPELSLSPTQLAQKSPWCSYALIPHHDQWILALFLWRLPTEVDAS